MSLRLRLDTQSIPICACDRGSEARRCALADRALNGYFAAVAFSRDVTQYARHLRSHGALRLCCRPVMFYRSSAGVLSHKSSGGSAVRSIVFEPKGLIPITGHVIAEFSSRIKPHVPRLGLARCHCVDDVLKWLKPDKIAEGCRNATFYFERSYGATSGTDIVAGRFVCGKALKPLHSDTKVIRQPLRNLSQMKVSSKDSIVLGLALLDAFVDAAPDMLKFSCATRSEIPT
ncbi:hypothetical protein EVAR_78465_1 [Eumeta japonica]|uniref:Uncharacterized protein n=1 Tax=Eumeta variegata TaxID=151549 RepID=A0A4C1TZG0_EUMVA|nr:hypothetical protein EVAR_78465_1 [Eumeta japonica]